MFNTTQGLENPCHFNESYGFLKNSDHDEPTHPSGTVVSTAAVSILTSLLSLMIVVGNGLIIMSVAVVKKLRQPANYLIVSLALSDFLVGLVVLPLTIVYDIGGEWVFGSMMCDVHVGFDVICCSASIMNLCMISIDRYLMITRPMTYPKKRNGKLMIILIATAWLLSCLVILPALFGFTRNVKDGPSWIQLNSTFETKNSSMLDQETSTQREFGQPYNTSAETLGNSSLLLDYRNNLILRNHLGLTIDLGNTYRVSKIGVKNVESKVRNASFYIIEVFSCDDYINDETKGEFALNPEMQNSQERLFNRSFETRLLGVTINQTIGGIYPNSYHISVYGEKMRGKTCLISQEVWFTIYSTVSAFYIPLAVMLCMYWKIYVEAVKVKSRRRYRRYSCVQTYMPSSQPRETPDFLEPDIRKPSQTPFLKAVETVNNNNEKGGCDTAQVNEKGDSKINCCDDFQDPASPNKLLKDNDVATPFLSHCEKEDANSDVEAEEDTTTCECELVSYEKDTYHGSADTLCEVEPCFVGKENCCCGVTKEYLEQLDLKNTLLLNVNKRSSLSIRNTSSPSKLENRILKDDHSNGLKEKKILNQGSMNNLSLNGGNERQSKHCVAIPKDRVSFCHVTSSVSSDATLSPSFPNEVKTSSFLENENCSQTSKINKVKNNYLLETRKRSLLAVLRNFFSKLMCCRHRSPPKSIFSSKSFKQRASSKRSYRRRIYKLRKRKSYKKCSRNISNEEKSSVFKQIKQRVSMATSRDRKLNVKATRTLGIIVGAFTFCWLPFFIVTFLRPFICDDPESQDCIPFGLVRLVLWLGYLNSALNPLIYIGFSPDLRETFRILIRCKCTNVDRRLAQNELMEAISREKKASSPTLSRCQRIESIL